MKEIETKRFLLKKLEKKYLNNIYSILSSSLVIQNLNMKIHKNIQDTEKLLQEYEEGYQRREKYPFEILDKNTLEFIGVFLIKLDLYDEDSFEFTIYLDRKYWNQGIYQEILPYMKDYAFLEIGTMYFRGFVMEKNIASRRVLEKCGFSLEKVFSVPGINDSIYDYVIKNDHNVK
ncbi:MAG: GNAT family N-acetyltransferase [Bacilli bacterium]|nr:GNAT family N-acetyltransferase [Bacilli bacterium]